MNPIRHDEVRLLFQRSAQANAALVSGNVDRYFALIPHADDFVLMTPFGGPPTRGSARSAARMQQLRGFFQSGTGEFELIAAYPAADQVVLVVLERLRCRVGGLPEQDWSLRVTLVYQRLGIDWQLVHRHADPLANGIDLERAAQLARGAVRE
jgi:ketosteroid isomerase-like protein